MTEFVLCAVCAPGIGFVDSGCRTPSTQASTRGGLNLFVHTRNCFISCGCRTRAREASTKRGGGPVYHVQVSRVSAFRGSRCVAKSKRTSLMCRPSLSPPERRSRRASRLRFAVALSWSAGGDEAGQLPLRGRGEGSRRAPRQAERCKGGGGRSSRSLFRRVFCCRSLSIVYRRDGKGRRSSSTACP